MPTIGPLFMLNVVASVAIAAWVLLRGDLLSLLAGIGLSLGTFGGFLIARYGTLFEYSEPRWRTSAILAAIVEIGAAALLAAVVVRRRQEQAA